MKNSNTNKKSKLNSAMKRIFKPLLMKHHISSKLEFAVKFISELQVIAFLITQQLSLISNQSTDPFIKFIQRFSADITLTDLIPYKFQNGLLIFVTIYLFLLIFLILLNSFSEQLFVALRTKINHRISVLGFTHHHIISFWLSQICIWQIENTGASNYKILAIVIVALNFIFGTLCSLYCNTPLFKVNSFGTSNQILIGLFQILKLCLTLLNLLPGQENTMLVCGIVSTLYYAYKLLKMIIGFPFFHFGAMRFELIMSFSGLAVSGCLLVLSIFPTEKKIINSNYFFYFEVLILPIVIQTAYNLSLSRIKSHNSEEITGSHNRKSSIYLMLSALEYNTHPSILKDLNKSAKVFEALAHLNSSSYFPVGTEALESLKQDFNQIYQIRDKLMIKILEEGILRCKNKTYLNILLAEAYLEDSSSLQKAVLLLESIGTGTFYQNLIISVLRQKAKHKLRVSGEYVQIENFMKTETILEQVTERIFTSIEEQKKFWKEFEEPDITLQRQLDKNALIEARAIEIQHLWKNLDETYPQVFDVLPLLAFYQAGVMNAPHTADRTLKRFFKILNLKSIANDLDFESLQTSKFTIQDPSNIILKVSLNRNTFGKILRANRNLASIGWAQQEVVNSYVTKLIPDFISHGSKFSIEILNSLQSEHNFLNKDFFGFAKDPNGYIIPCRTIICLDPDVTSGLNYIIFCKIIETEERYIIVDEREKILCMTKQFAQEAKVEHESNLSIKDVSQGFILSETNVSCGSSLFGISTKKLRYSHEYKYTEKNFQVNSKTYKLISLEVIKNSKLFNKEILSEQVAFPDLSCCSEAIIDKKSLNVVNYRLEVQDNLFTSEVMAHNRLNELKVDAVIEKKGSQILSHSIRMNEQKLSSFSIDEKNENKNKIVLKSKYLGSSTHRNSTTNINKRNEENIYYLPRAILSIAVRALLAILFILSSSLLIGYFFNLSQKFSKIKTNMDIMYYTNSEMQMILETRRLSNLYIYTDMGLVRLTRYASLGFSIYSPSIKATFLRYQNQNKQYYYNLTNLIEEEPSLVSTYYKRDIPTIDPNDLAATPKNVGITELINNLILSCTKIFKTTVLKKSNTVIQNIKLNYKDKLLTNMEDVAETAYLNTMSALDDCFSIILTYIGVIAGFGLMLFIVVMVRQRRMSRKKDQLLAVLSMLDEKAIGINLDVLSSFLIAAKQSSKEMDYIEWYNKLQDEHKSKKKDTKKSISNLKKINSIKKSNLVLYKIFSIILSFIILMILPFIVIYGIFVSGGDKDYMKRLIDIEYNTANYYYELRLLLCTVNDYFASNATDTLRSNPIVSEYRLLQDRLSYFQEFLVNTQGEFKNQTIKDYITGDLCKKFTDSFCKRLGSGAASRGLIGINSAQLSILDKVISTFDASRRTINDTIAAMNHPDSINSELFDVLYTITSYNVLLKMEAEVTKNQVLDSESRIIIIIIVFFVCNLQLGLVINRTLAILMAKEIDTWTKLVRRVPYHIISQSKILQAYLNDYSKRSFE